MKVVIVGEHKDIHVQYVSRGLKQMGYATLVWQSISVGDSQLTLYPDDDKIRIGDTTITPDDHVWFRRMFNPVELHPNLHQDDKQFVAQESNLIYKAALSWLSERATFSANDFYAHLNIENKSRQLQIAKATGLNVPQTLFSNNHQAVIEFIEEHQKVIHKTARQYTFKGDQDVSVTASLVSLDRMQNPFMAESCPSIYQRYVEKAYDVRLVVFGQYYFAVKIAAKDESELIDWRPKSMQVGQLQYEQIAIPGQTKQQIAAFMAKANLVMGQFDFSVDASGQWWFLEVNSQGQWLFLEDWLEDLNILGRFCAFMVEGPDYDGSNFDKTICSKYYD